MKKLKEKNLKYCKNGGDEDDRSIILVPTTKTSVGITLLVLIITATYLTILYALTTLGLSLSASFIVGLILLVLINATAFIADMFDKQFIEFTRTLVG